MARRKEIWGKAARWIALGALSAWGILSFALLIGEESPGNPMTMGEFFLIKAAAVASLLLCCLVGKKMNREGYLPDEWDKYADN